MLCRRSRGSRAAVLDLAGECNQRSSQSEVLVAPQFGDGLNAKDVGKDLVVALRQTRQSRRRSGEDLRQTLVFAAMT